MAGPPVTGPPGAQSPQPVPVAAAAVFGERLPLAARYAELLCTDGVLRGVIGPREPARIWTRHLLNSAAIAPHVPPDASVIDLGSGAGLPGVPIVLARPDLAMTLLEPLARRMRFLVHVRDVLGLGVELLQVRAQDCQETADVVLARAVAPLDRLLELALPLLRPGGVLLAQKGAHAHDEVAAAQGDLDRLGPLEVSVHPVLPAGGGVAPADPSEQTWVVRVVTSSEGLPLASARPRAGKRPGRGIR